MSDQWRERAERAEAKATEAVEGATWIQDKYEEMKAERDAALARVKELEEALRGIISSWGALPDGGGGPILTMECVKAYERARAVLAKGKP